MHRSHFLGLATTACQEKKLLFPSLLCIFCLARFETGGMKNAAKTRELCFSKGAYQSYHTLLIQALLEVGTLNRSSQILKEGKLDAAVGDERDVSSVPLPMPP